MFDHSAPTTTPHPGLIAGFCLDDHDVIDAIRHHFISMGSVTLSAPLPERHGALCEVLQ